MLANGTLSAQNLHHCHPSALQLRQCPHCQAESAQSTTDPTLQRVEVVNLFI
jgi:hypothetical protein